MYRIVTRIIVTIFWTFAFFVADAQEFDCEYIKAVYNRLPTGIKLSSSGTIKSFPVKISKQGDLVTNVGVELTTKLPAEYSLVDSFISRTILELALSDSYKDIVRVLEHNKTELQFNGDDFIRGPYWDISKGLDVIKSYNHLDISRDSLFYYVSWRAGADKLMTRIPSNIQILTGKDKKELEDSFEYLLKSFSTSDSTTVAINEKLLLQQGNLFVDKSKYLFVEDMNNARFFSKDSSGKYKLIFSADYIGESLSNIFQHNLPCSEKIELHISQQLYGKLTKQYQIKLKDLVSFAQMNGFEVFVGLENVSKDNIEATIILKNKEFNFIHMLHVKSDVNTLFNADKGAIAARLYTYIPSDNIVNLFEEYKSKPRYDELIPYLK